MFLLSDELRGNAQEAGDLITDSWRLLENTEEEIYW